MASTASSLTATGPRPGQQGDKGADAPSRVEKVTNGPDEADWPADHEGPTPDQSAVAQTRRSTVRSWPLLVLAAPAAVAVWSGWVGIGQMTGFGEIHPLPGIWDSLRLDTAVTLPIGVEAYAAFALRVWLTSNPVVSERTRRFARQSAIAALVLGMAGQVAYHLLAQAGVNRAPWEVTTVVACLPVLVLGLGSALAHLLRSNVGNATLDDRRTQCASPVGALTGLGGTVWPVSAYEGRARPPARARLADAQITASKVLASGERISRRSLRSAGMRGSNADLGLLARQIRTAQER